MGAAIQRTGQQYTADLRVMLAELREVYEGQIAAKDAALAAKDETIAELRRRAEVAEAQLQRRREADQARILRQAEATVQAAQDGAHVEEALAVAPEDVGGVWGRLRRWFERG